MFLRLIADNRDRLRRDLRENRRRRARRWADSLASAGATELSHATFDALQRTVTGNARVVRLGLRIDGGFVGEHDRQTHAPIPNHVCARADDLPSLMRGLLAYDQRAWHGALDPVVAVAVEAFGLVYVHPFEDGNGRIHRWLLHHVLATGALAPPIVVLPVSAAICNVPRGDGFSYGDYVEQLT